MSRDSRIIVHRALITEKGSILREKARQYTFEVHPDARDAVIRHGANLAKGIYAQYHWCACSRYR